MHLKKFLFSGSFILALSFLGACTDREEPSGRENPLEGKDLIDWPVSVNLPEEFRTRSAAQGSVGSDGLYAFTRDIDRLWYAVYYNDTFLYDSENPSAPETVKTEDGFQVFFKFHQQIDPSQVKIFFWAGNKEDNVTVANVTKSNSITLNFENRCVSVDPKYMNGGNMSLQEYDSFSGYVRLSEKSGSDDYNRRIVLKRPFAQIHVLSDEFTYPGVSIDFPNGVTMVPGFGTDDATVSNYTSNLLAPTTWFFDSSVSLTPTYGQNEFIYSQNNYEFTNRLSGSTPERVRFKDRDMDYLGCFYVFAPIEKAPLKFARSTGNSSSLTKLNLAFRKPSESLSNAEYASVELPAEGIQANNRYVVYNHENTGDGDGGHGEGGFVTNTFTFEILTDPAWDDTVESEY